MENEVVSTPEVSDESEEITWGERLLKQDRTLSPRHRKLCELAAQGVPSGKIAEQLAYSPGRVSVILSDPLVREEIARLRDRIFEESVGKRLRDLTRPALDELEKCLGDKSNRYKEVHKLDIAKWIVEKVDGKAIQKYDVGENMLSVMLDKLDAMKSAGQPALNEARPAIEGDFSEIPAELPPKTEEDLLKDWVVDFSAVKNI